MLILKVITLASLTTLILIGSHRAKSVRSVVNQVPGNSVSSSIPEPSDEDLEKVMDVKKWIKVYEADQMSRFERTEIRAVHNDLDALDGVTDGNRYHLLTAILWYDMGVLAVLDNELYRNYFV